jgi:hypothetical protein
VVRTTPTWGAQEAWEEGLVRPAAAPSQALFGQAPSCWLYDEQSRSAVLWPLEHVNLWPGVTAEPAPTLAVQAPKQNEPVTTRHCTSEAHKGISSSLRVP